MRICELCGEKTVIKVAENQGINFYSCCNEDCVDYAELLTETNNGLEYVHSMLNAYREMVKEVIDEKDKLP